MGDTYIPWQTASAGDTEDTTLGTPLSLGQRDRLALCLPLQHAAAPGYISETDYPCMTPLHSGWRYVNCRLGEVTSWLSACLCIAEAPSTGAAQRLIQFLTFTADATASAALPRLSLGRGDKLALSLLLHHRTTLCRSPEGDRARLIAGDQGRSLRAPGRGQDALRARSLQCFHQMPLLVHLRQHRAFLRHLLKTGYEPTGLGCPFRPLSSSRITRAFHMQIISRQDKTQQKGQNAPLHLRVSISPLNDRPGKAECLSRDSPTRCAACHQQSRQPRGARQRLCRRGTRRRPHGSRASAACAAPGSCASP